MTEIRSRLYVVMLILSPVILYAYLNYYTAVLHIRELISLEAYLRVPIWLAFYTMCFALFLTLLVLFRGWKLYVFVAVAFVSMLTNTIFTSITGRSVNPDVVGWLIDQKGTFQNAYTEFFGQFALHGALVIGAMALLLVWRSAILRNAKIQTLVPKRGLWAVGAVIVFLGINLGCFLLRPAFLPAEVNVPFFAIDTYFTPEPEPGTVHIDPVVRTDVNKIVLIVDESVRFDYFNKIVSDSLGELPHIDYGEAVSTANCSAGSEALLRWGIDHGAMMRKDYNPRKAIYIWSYAKHAGYKTVLIDGQMSLGSFQNFMGVKERQLIDEQLFPKGGPGTDHLIALELRKRFSDTTKQFIFVVKRGVHFPYNGAYPEGYLSEQATRSEKYQAAIRYNSGIFFGELKGGIDYSRVFMIYTSDHGQDLVEERLPNCNGVPDWQEYSVPLVVFTDSRDIRNRLSASAAMVRNHASHEQIFPTLLYAMGYAPGMDSPRYAPTLNDRCEGYTVLLPPSIPLPGRDYNKGISFKVFDNFPYRQVQQ